MYFSKETSALDLYQGERVDILFSIDINEWYGRKTVQLILKDLRPAEHEENELALCQKRFGELMNGAPLAVGENVIPAREDFAAVYTVLRRCVRAGEDTLSVRRMQSLLYADGKDIDYIKLRLVYCILEELNLLEAEETEKDTFRFRLRFTSSRVDLERSRILYGLRSRTRMG